MKWAIFLKSLRDSWKGMLGWGIGLGLYALLTAGLYPTILDQREELEAVMEQYQDSIFQFLGTDDVLSPSGYLQARLFAYLPLLLGIYGILQGLNSVTGEERKQTMDTLVALPIPRWQILTEKFLATVVVLVGILTQFFIALLIGRAIWPELEVSTGNLAAATYSSLPALLVITGVAYLLSASLPMHRRWGGMIATLFLVSGYLIYSLGNISEVIEPLQPLTVFKYYEAGEILRLGWQLGDTIVLTAVAVGLLATSLFTFERRDLGT
jgi:ABC-2 type transport system permease protein